ncbi:unnamed protein product [Oncorhynchus mykiss]|uniref:Uncharacterized protein n=1 Tax=Oncorhynchus mykiss TaxID=8022 RepID=A0A060WQA4_ONCMY|nr:unnamed protein product [Oncorhynchus mykiss]
MSSSWLKLAGVVAVQRGSQRERAGFMVPSQTLLQGLGDVSETQHLHTAQCVYSLLEPSMLELSQKDMPQQQEDIHGRVPVEGRADRQRMGCCWCHCLEDSYPVSSATTLPSKMFLFRKQLAAYCFSSCSSKGLDITSYFSHLVTH